MAPPDYPNSDDSYGLLYRLGWTIGDIAYHVYGRAEWLVTGHNAENVIRAEGATKAEAWHRACDQARAADMLYRRAGAAPIRHDMKRAYYRTLDPFIARWIRPTIPGRQMA